MPRRPDGISTEQANVIAAAIYAGNYQETACGVAGVPQSTFYEWLRRGREERERRETGGRPKATWHVYLTFLEMIEKANADAEASAIQTITDARPDNWQAAAWWLERRFPSRFGRVTRTEISGRDGQGVPVNVTQQLEVSMDAEAIGKMMEVMARAGLVDEPNDGA